MIHSTRREFMKTAGAGLAVCALPKCLPAAEQGRPKKRHILTLSFDDGFKKSSIRTAEIFEKHKLAACINVIATGHLKDFVTPDQYQEGIPKGDFGLWNELQQRSHEIMPHGYRHANKRNLPLEEAKDLILRCLEVFSKELKGFQPKQAVFNFPYNASTPELAAWLPAYVKTFRTGGDSINPWPHQGQVRLTCRGFGPGNAEQALDREIERLLVRESGWLIFNLHGLDDEGWGPIRASYLDSLLARLSSIASLDILPAGRALAKYAETGD
jgi:peptidoglycan/xylan/chitin deacetylase (PgdA/CDA1 family)